MQGDEWEAGARILTSIIQTIPVPVVGAEEELAIMFAHPLR